MRIERLVLPTYLLFVLPQFDELSFFSNKIRFGQIQNFLRKLHLSKNVKGMLILCWLYIMLACLCNFVIFITCRCHSRVPEQADLWYLALKVQRLHIAIIDHP